MILMVRQQHQAGMESGEMNTSVVWMLVDAYCGDNEQNIHLFAHFFLLGE